MLNTRPRKPNPTDSWVAPEHARMGQGMRRYKNGFRDESGEFVHYPGERVLPEPECIRRQNESEAIKRLMVDLGMKFIPPEIAMQYLRPKKIFKKYVDATF